MDATTNYFAPDFELGFASTYSWPAPNRDLATLSGTCHSRGMRFIADMSMACSPDHPYFATSRERFFNGGDAFRYEALEETYDPVSGSCGQFSPARQLMKTAVDRWIRDFQIDGIRLDSVEQIQSEDFVQELREHARQRNYERFASLGIATSADERFIVFGKEFSQRQELLAQRRLDGLWHEAFKHHLRMALIGHQHESEPSFESTVRRAIDCRTFGFTDLTQAVIYLTSHDVEGFRNERLFNFFLKSGVTDAEKRTKLAFACLLTAVGTPMILAGDEFADRHDSFDENGNVSRHGGVEPVSFSRLNDDWRARIKTYVSRLIRLRTTYDALAVNDVEFIHVDFDEGKRVLVWRRGAANSDSQVIVVANFSDFTTPEANEPHAEYLIPGWPEAPAHKRWREVPQDRWVEAGRAGREPIYSWEAKVYALE